MIRFRPWEWDDEDGEEADRAELRAEGRAERRRAAALLAHPDPRDPDWPGHWEAEHDQEFDENRVEDDDD